MFCCSSIKTCVIYVLVSFFFFLTPFFGCGAVFMGNIQPIEKKLLDFQMQNFMLNLLNEKII